VKPGIPVLFHLPYSPDLVPADFFLFQKLKIAMKGMKIEVVSSIQETAERTEGDMGRSVFLGIRFVV
jgi:hypothetical protein